MQKFVMFVKKIGNKNPKIYYICKENLKVNI